MRVITHCPSCQTQFFATEEQLNQHDGKVRCGQCRHVFNARAQIVNVAQDVATDTLAAPPPASIVPVADVAIKASPAPTGKNKSKKTKTSKSIIETGIAQPAYLDDISGKSKLNRKLPGNTFKPWLWATASVLACLLAIAQSVYFLRNEIAIYYPQFKPVLIKSCQMLHCTIQLPEQIEFVVIDDSDMQEDPERVGLIYFTSTLINTGSHVVAYPNLELTLTDVEDNPVVRRIFKPAEYLPAHLNLQDGFAVNTEIKIKLAMTSSENKVSGYRVFVTY